MQKQGQVKNRAAAKIQITAEQIIQEANDRRVDSHRAAPNHMIMDQEELKDYQSRKRKEFEDAVRRQRHHVGNWIKYAHWEEIQKEFERARSVYERALEVDYRNASLYLKYADMEMRNKFVNHARNIWERAVTTLPRVDQFWYKYAFMEEMLGNADQVTAIFERWMRSEPSDNAWNAYIKFAMRLGNVSLTRSIYDRYVSHQATASAFIKYAKWEEKLGEASLCRSVYERAFSCLVDEEKNESLYCNFAKFEESIKEIDRASSIYKYAISALGRESNPALYNEYLSFERRHGSVDEIDASLLIRLRNKYRLLVDHDPFDYDAWFDYIRLEEHEGGDDGSIVTRLYKQATDSVPRSMNKNDWRRYIYLWVNWSIYLELNLNDVDGSAVVLRKCLGIIPHAVFTFGKIWIMLAQLEVRRGRLDDARKVYGQAIGMTKKRNVMLSYIHLETTLGEFDRCRIIYSKLIEAYPSEVDHWLAFIDLEIKCGEVSRCRNLFELALKFGKQLDNVDELWVKYIEFEAANDESDDDEAVCRLYERLLIEDDFSAKIWNSYAKHKAKRSIYLARGIFERALDVLKNKGSEFKSDRLAVLNYWREIEFSNETDGDVNLVDRRMPRKVIKRRRDEQVMQEYYDLVFPDDGNGDEEKGVNLKILQAANKWKSSIVDSDA